MFKLLAAVRFVSQPRAGSKVRVSALLPSVQELSWPASLYDPLAMAVPPLETLVWRPRPS